jgi:hypothetical protein
MTTTAKNTKSKNRKIHQSREYAWMHLIFEHATEKEKFLLLNALWVYRGMQPRTRNFQDRMVGYHYQRGDSRFTIRFKKKALRELTEFYQEVLSAPPEDLALYVNDIDEGSRMTTHAKVQLGRAVVAKYRLSHSAPPRRNASGNAKVQKQEQEQ